MKEPNTLEGYFHMLDCELTEEEQKELAESEDLIDYHFGLGTWIRNTWIYPDQNYTLVKLVTKCSNANPYAEGEDFEFLHPEEISSAFLELYQKYLCYKLGIEYVNIDDESYDEE